MNLIDPLVEGQRFWFRDPVACAPLRLRGTCLPIPLVGPDGVGDLVGELDGGQAVLGGDRRRLARAHRVNKGLQLRL